MIPANHKRIYLWFFRHYSSLMINRSFRPVRVHSDFEDQGRPLMLIGNHFSWWDGFFAIYLNSLLFRRKFYVMMLEEQLSRRMFLSKTGAFSIKKGSRSLIESIDYAASILRYPGNILVMYPQGEIESLHKRPLLFQKGIADVCKKAGEDFDIVFYVALVDYFSKRKPSLQFYVKTHDKKKGITEYSLQDAYNDFYGSSILRQEEK